VIPEKTMSQAILCIFAKPPVPGKVKTRLIPAVNPAQAARLAAAFLEDVTETCRQIAGTTTIIATDGDWSKNLQPPRNIELWQQGDGDLGNRMERILERALQSAPLAIAIGADVPLISAEIIEDALEKLQQNDAVLGPSEDGGYYLLGLRRSQAGLLENLPWSQPHTRQATRLRLESLGLTVADTQLLFDIDTPQDLERLQKHHQCPATHGILREIRGSL
jgi:rSAM/selenodomain-associated transferase 1